MSASPSFAADRTAPRAVADWLSRAWPASGIPTHRLADVQLCVDELVTNVVRHSRTIGAARTVRVRLEPGPDEVVLVVEDDGGEFDPRTVPDPPVARRLEDAPVGGRGIALVRQMADEIDYERNDSVNRVTLLFRHAG